MASERERASTRPRSLAEESPRVLLVLARSPKFSDFLEHWIALAHKSSAEVHRVGSKAFFVSKMASAGEKSCFNPVFLRNYHICSKKINSKFHKRALLARIIDPQNNTPSIMYQPNC